MSTLELSPVSTLPSVYADWTEEQFIQERSRVQAEVAIEQHWIESAGLHSYATDEDMLPDMENGRLVRVSQGAGYLVIDKLLLWGPTHSDPAHEFYYSVPYLGREAFDYLEGVAVEWQAEVGESRLLSVTSLGRSDTYQAEMGARRRKITVASSKKSSHQAMISFDIDGCGLVETQDDGTIRKINPRYSGYDARLVEESQLVLRYILFRDKMQGRINCVEELPKTQEHTFHVAVKPAGL